MAPSSPRPAPAWAKASRMDPPVTSIRPTCSPVPTRKRKKIPTTSSRRARCRRWSRRYRRGRRPKSCDTIPYEPKLNVDPGTAFTDSPTGAKVDVDVPHILEADEQDSSNTRTAQVSLPKGMGLNPSAANGLQACDDGQFGKETRNPVTCPDASKIGAVTIDSPPLRDEDLTGSVYVGTQKSRDPASGQRVPDLRPRSVPSLRRRCPPRRQRPRRSGDRSADHHLLRNPAGAVYLLRARLRRWPESGSQQPADLRTEQSNQPDDALVGQPAGLAGVADRSHHRPRRRPLCENAGRTPLRSGLRGKAAGRQSRRLQPGLARHPQQRRSAGAQGRRHHPRARDDRQARRHSLLPGGGDRRRGRERRQGGARPLELPRAEPGRRRHDQDRNRSSAD